MLKKIKANVIVLKKKMLKEATLNFWKKMGR